MTRNYTPDESTSIKVGEESIFKRFCENRELSDRTINLYKIALSKYCNFIGKTLDELLNEAEDEEDSISRLRRRSVTKYLEDFERYLKDHNYSPSTISGTMINVKAFYNHYKIVLPKYEAKRSRKSNKSRQPKSIEAIPKMEEIQLLLESCNELYKVIVLLGVSSGMGRAEIANLKFKHLYEACELDPYPETMPELIKKIKNKDHFIPTWQITRVKTGMDYYTFTTPELMKHMILYLERIHFKFPEFNPVPEDGLIRTLRYNKPTDIESISSFFGYVNSSKGFRKYKDRYVLLPHGFRKFFASTLEKNKMPHIITRRLMGHKISGTTGSYFFTEIEDAKEDYLEVVNALSTDKVEIMQVNIYKDLEKRISELELEKVHLKDRI